MIPAFQVIQLCSHNRSVVYVPSIYRITMSVQTIIWYLHHWQSHWVRQVREQLPSLPLYKHLSSSLPPLWWRMTLHLQPFYENDHFPWAVYNKPLWFCLVCTPIPEYHQEQSQKPSNLCINVSTQLLSPNIILLSRSEITFVWWSQFPIQGKLASITLSSLSSLPAETPISLFMLWANWSLGGLTNYPLIPE